MMWQLGLLAWMLRRGIVSTVKMSCVDTHLAEPQNTWAMSPKAPFAREIVPGPGLGT